jgi:hypothetical protein
MIEKWLTRIFVGEVMSKWREEEEAKGERDIKCFGLSKIGVSNYGVFIGETEDGYKLHTQGELTRIQWRRPKDKPNTKHRFRCE